MIVNKVNHNSQSSKSPIAKTIKESSEKIKKALHTQEQLHLNLGYVLGLFSSSKYHAKLSIGHFMASVIPALKHNQFKIFFRGFRPIAFVSWALLSDEVAKKFKEGKHILTIDEWKTGDEIWLGEFISPYSDEDREAVVKNIKEKVFPEKTINILIRNEDGSVKEIIKDFKQ